LAPLPQERGRFFGLARAAMTIVLYRDICAACGPTDRLEPSRFLVEVDQKREDNELGATAWMGPFMAGASSSD